MIRGRNFRAAYLSTLGFQGAELKNALESIFQETVVDAAKLRKICEKYDLPVGYRALVWKILLGVISGYKDTWEEVLAQRRDQYMDLKSAARLVSRALTPPTEKAFVPNDESKHERMASVITLTHRSYQYITSEASPSPEKDEEDPEELHQLAFVFSKVFENEPDAFWGFHKFIKQRVNIYGHHSTGIYHQLNTLSRLLQTHEPDIVQHFKTLNIHIDQFAYTWFRSYFASCLPYTTLIRIWDRVIGISQDIVACVGLSILMSLKSEILKRNDPKSLKQYLSTLADINIDVVLTKTMEVYAGFPNEL